MPPPSSTAWKKVLLADDAQYAKRSRSRWQR
jgi:hypothetical protein